jgi:hypothetical protein
MEAMRLSLLEHEAQQRREAEQQAQSSPGDSGSQSRIESGNSPPSPLAAETSSSDVDAASPTVASTVTPPAPSISPSSTPPDLPNPSSPNPPPLTESPPNGSGDLDSPEPSFQPSPSPTQHSVAVSRIDSLASSVSTHETDAGLEGYRFLTSESEESVVAREPLLHLEDGDG